MSDLALSTEILTAIREVYGVSEGVVPLHVPVFDGNEKTYVIDTIDSTFVSSVGAYVGRLEEMMCKITGARHAIATVNGTTALQMAMILAGVKPGDMVVTQSLSFVATANAAAHAGAVTAFVDIDAATLGLCPKALRSFLETQAVQSDGGTHHRDSGRRIGAVVPMHTFGNPCDLDGLLTVCEEWNIPLIEDAAESLGSLYRGRPCGTFGLMGTVSFNGNKIVTTGGGGVILTNDSAIAKRAKHLTTTAKLPHAWRFTHDEIGYNFRMPNLNAALGCAQLEQLDRFVAFKRDLAARYHARFSDMGIEFVVEPPGTQSNYWLCAILLSDTTQRNAVLETTNAAGVMTRPVWDPVHQLEMYRHAPHGPMPVTSDIAARLVNIPSGFRPNAGF
ncbi:MAG: aminotransferase DegT [Rhizobiales bacterium 24-66-13]|jgi:aminotransferase in exopolysaccharide biosynthesis|nr:MAG: aminotransferase DegT [Rhizobiales bacterium 35-66-30]OYZ82029.1 MAG: aminotransferase DegT [Rhizobiales bacterium 24-66-13]OZB11009.1 MAG: aminotransferase DegT [Rhizobiales bacterium 39-66-18]HQS47106.1 LegC family aminotransferase [Xanthobacteraceae bacterium]